VNEKRRKSGYAELKKLMQSGSISGNKARGKLVSEAIAPAKAPQKAPKMPPKTSNVGETAPNLTAQNTRLAVQQLVVEESADAQRVDNFLLRVLKGAPRSLIYRILRSGEVRVNGARAKPDRRLSIGDTVRVPPLRLGEAVANVPDSSKIDWLAAHVLADEGDLIVLNKPSGLASHGGSGISFGAIEALRALYPDCNLELVHRLDRDTSGLLLIAKKRAALTQLQTLMREGGMRKVYLALAHGLPAQDRFEVRLKLKKYELAGGERIVKISEEGKAALSYFRVLERFPADTMCLLEVALGTGRTHQIRAHAQAVDLPLAGDSKYHGGRDAKALQTLGLRRLFLHAHSLRWTSAEQERRYQAELPDDLARVLTQLRARSAAVPGSANKLKP
jgi:23S rRNA pseudouridine955/2504/2580 synthase